MAKVLKQIFVLFAMLAIFALTVESAPSQESCGPNEEFVTCGSSCAPACGQKANAPCTLQCIIGCQCKSGYLKSGSGACVTQC